MPGQNSKQMHNIRLSLRQQQQLRQQQWQQLRQQQQLQLQHHQRGCSPSLLLHYYKLPQLPCSRACCLNQIPYAAHFSQENSNNSSSSENITSSLAELRWLPAEQEAQVQNITNLPSNANQAEMRAPSRHSPEILGSYENAGTL